MTVTSILYPQDRSFSLSWYPLFVLVLKEVSVSFSAYTFGSGARVWCYAALWSMRTPGVEYFLALESLFFHRVIAFMSLSQLVTQISGLPCLMTCENYGTRGVWRDKVGCPYSIVALALSSSLLRGRFLCRHATLLLSLVLLFNLRGQEFPQRVFSVIFDQKRIRHHTP